MKTRTMVIVGVLGLSMIPVLISGCLRGRVDLVDNQTVSLERASTKHLYISWATVYQEAAATEVRGEIRRRYRGRGGDVGHGHIDVAVFAPDGTVLEEVSALYYPRHISKKHAAYFTARLSKVPPRASTVRLAHHRDGYSLRRAFNCDKNAACPPVKETDQ
jgi:hypothetical protein